MRRAAFRAIESLQAAAGGTAESAARPAAAAATSRSFARLHTGNPYGRAAACVLQRTAASPPPLPPRRQAPAGHRSFAAEAAADNADTANLAPCERPAEQQAANKVDEELRSAATHGPTAVLSLIDANGEHFTELNVVSALNALSAAAAAGGGSGAPTPEEIVRADGFQALVDMTLAGLQRFPHALLAEAVHACGTLGASEEMLLDEIGRHIMGFTHELTPSDISHLACGYAALDHSPSLVLFQSMASRAADLQQEFSADQRRDVAAAYAALGYAHVSPFQ